MTTASPIDGAVLDAHALPEPGAAASKHDRGSVLVIGGHAQTPGALLLAGTAALRAGAGRLMLAGPAAAAPGLALAVPEAGVLAVPTAGGGGLDPDALGPALDVATDADCVLLGPGMLGAEEAARPLAALVERLQDGQALLALDAGALAALADGPDLGSVSGRTILIPNPGEAAELLGEDDVEAADAVGRLVDRFGCTVAVRGPETYVATADDGPFVEPDGPVGLATSGSGDVLAGFLAGVAARGGDPLAATLHAVHAHAAAGRACTDQRGPVGFLARELVDVIATAAT